MGRAITAPCYRPSLADLKGSFEQYIESIEKEIADVGICKIIAPKVSCAIKRRRSWWGQIPWPHLTPHPMCLPA